MKETNMKSVRTILAVAFFAALHAPLAAQDKAGDAKDEKPNAKVTELLTKLAKDIDGAKDVSDDVKAFTKKHILPLCTNKVFVKETKALNDKKTSLDEIKKIDKQWMDAEEELPIQKEKMNNDCAKEIKRIAKDIKAMGETFVMDNQGAVVGESALTSDYWQGDEPKWSNSYKEGKGGVDFGKVTLDKSTNITDQKVSVPIIADDGTVIGAVCVGVLIDKIKG